MKRILCRKVSSVACCVSNFERRSSTMSQEVELRYLDFVCIAGTHWNTRIKTANVLKRVALTLQHFAGHALCGTGGSEISTPSPGYLQQRTSQAVLSHLILMDSHTTTDAVSVNSDGREPEEFRLTLNFLLFLLYYSCFYTSFHDIVIISFLWTSLLLINDKWATFGYDRW